MSGRAVTLTPTAVYPRTAYEGQKISLELGIKLGNEDWPYEEDSFLLGVMVSGSGLTTYSTGPTHIKLNRDGTASSVRYDVEFKSTGKLELWVSYITQGGVPFSTFKLPVQVNPPPMPVQVNGQLVPAPVKTEGTMRFVLDHVPDVLRVGQTYVVNATLVEPDQDGPLWELSDLDLEVAYNWVRASASEGINIAELVLPIEMHRDGRMTSAALSITPIKTGSGVLQFEFIVGNASKSVLAEYRHTVRIIE